MTGKTLIEPVNPKTQSIDGVKILTQCRGHPTSPMPTDVTLGNGRMVLVLSNKKDAYYTVTAKACSHLVATYHCGLCKHQRRYFADQIVKPAEMVWDMVRFLTFSVTYDGLHKVCKGY